MVNTKILSYWLLNIATLLGTVNCRISTLNFQAGHFVAKDLAATGEQDTAVLSAELRLVRQLRPEVKI